MFRPKQNAADHLLRDAVMPFGDHLEELRKRLIYALLGIAPILVGSLVFAKPLLQIVIEPVQVSLQSQGQSSSLIQTAPGETFMTSLQLAILVTILVGSPWILYQMWLFVAPGLYQKERRFVYVLTPLSALLTVTSVVFLYKVVMPLILGFFIIWGSSFSGPEPAAAPPPDGTVLPTFPLLEADPVSPEPGDAWINLQLREFRIALPEDEGKVAILGAPLHRSASIVQQYRVADSTKLFLSLAMSFALAFQSPVVILLLGWLGLIETGTLSRYRRHVIMICAVLGAVLTPADPLSMLALAIPLYGLFELGGLLLRILPAERVSRGFARKKEGADAGDE